MAASHGGLVGSLPPASARNTAAFGAASARHLSEEEDWFFDAEGHESPQDRIARESNDRLLELQEGDQIKTPTYGTRYLPYRYSTVRYRANMTTHQPDRNPHSTSSSSFSNCIASSPKQKLPV